jgi:hypothetical protein
MGSGARFATGRQRESAPRAVVEASLAHVVKDKTEAAYFRSDLYELRRTLMDSWAKFATVKIPPS